MYEDIVGAQRQGYAAMGGDMVPVLPQGNYYPQNPGYQGFEALVQRPVQQSQMGLAERDNLRFQRQWYGFPRTWICPGETVKIVGQAQVLMKIIRIFIDDSVGSSLLVRSLVIAKNDLINGDAVSATLFSPLATDAYPQTETETIQPGSSAAITLENIGETKLLVVVSTRVAVAW